MDGHKIVTYFEDTQGNPTIALSDAHDLVQQKHIQIMEGPLLASEDAAVAPYLGAENIPTDNLAFCSQTQIVMDAKYGNAFSSGWGCNQPDIAAADYLYSLGLRHVTVEAAASATSGAAARAAASSRSSPGSAGISTRRCGPR